MLLEVKCRTFDPISRRPRVEPVLVDAASGDEAAEMAHALKPGCHVVGIAPPDPEAARLHADRQAPGLEGESEAPDMSRDRPSARDLASVTIAQTMQAAPVYEVPPLRGRGKKADA